MTYSCKSIFLRTIVLLTVFIGYSSLALAQEEGMGELEQDRIPVSEESNSYNLDSERDLVPLKPLIKKSEIITSKPNPTKISKPESGEKKNSSSQTDRKEVSGKSEDQSNIIGYNFLHFFFQKYKMSEISE